MLFSINYWSVSNQFEVLLFYIILYLEMCPPGLQNCLKTCSFESLDKLLLLIGKRRYDQVCRNVASTWRRVADGGWCKFGSLVPDRISCLGSMDLGSPDDSYDGRILCSAGWWILIKKEEDGIKNAGARGCALLAPRISISINRRRCKMHFSHFLLHKDPTFLNGMKQNSFFF